MTIKEYDELKYIYESISILDKNTIISKLEPIIEANKHIKDIDLENNISLLSAVTMCHQFETSKIYKTIAFEITFDENVIPPIRFGKQWSEKRKDLIYEAGIGFFGCNNVPYTVKRIK